MATRKNAKEWGREHVSGLWGVHWVPFTEDYAIDEPALRRHIRSVVAQGLDGLGAAGLFGEMWYMTLEERFRVAEIVKEEVAGKFPLMLLAMDHSVATTMALVHRAEELEYDSVMIHVPYEHAKSDEAMYRFLKYVNDHSDIAIGVYNTPHAGRMMSPELVNAVTQIESVCAVKHATADFADYVRTVQLAGDRVPISHPFESTWLVQLQLFGARALYSSSAPNLLQTAEWQPIREYTQLARDGHWAEASQVYHSLDPLRSLWNDLYSVYREENRHPLAETKYWAHVIGILDDPRSRPPQKAVAPETTMKIREVLGTFPQFSKD
jgi:4-hydroxy-tetrahydrodipicolinate synthase